MGEALGLAAWAEGAGMEGQQGGVTELECALVRREPVWEDVAARGAVAEEREERLGALWVSREDLAGGEEAAM